MRVLRTSIVLVLLAAVATTAAAGTLDRLLPESTVLLVSVGDITEIEAKLKASPMHAFYQEKEVQEFLKLPRRAWDEAMEKAKGELGISPEEVLGALRGEMAFAVTGLRRLDDERQIIGVVALFRVGENEGKIRELIARIEENEEAMKHLRRVVTDARGAKIVSYFNKDDEDGWQRIEDDLFTGPPCYFLQDGLLAIANDVDVLQGILARSGSEDVPSLASHDQYRGMREQTGARSDFMLYVNALPIWEVLKEKSADEPMVARVMDALGVFSIRGLGYSMELTRDALVGRMFLDAPGEKRGLMRLLAAKNTALVPPKFVPPDAGSVMTMSFDFADLWAETRRVVERIDAAALKEMDAGIEGLKEQMGVDLVKDVIGSLGKEVTLYQLIKETTEGAMGPTAAFVPKIIVALAVNDPEALNGALGTLLENFPFITLAEEEYLGVKMRVMRDGPASPALATVAGHLVIAAHVEDLQAVIRATGKDVKGLVDTEAFARAMGRLPAERMMVTFSNPKLMHQAITDFLPNIPAANLADWVDLSLFPSWETFDKYFDVSSGVMMATDRGVLSVSRSDMKTPK